MRGGSLAWGRGLSDIRDQISGGERTATSDRRPGGKKKPYAEDTESTEFAEKTNLIGKRRGVVALERKSPPFAKGAKDGAPSSTWMNDITMGTRERRTRRAGSSGQSIMRTGPKMHKPGKKQAPCNPSNDPVNSEFIKRATKLCIKYDHQRRKANPTG